MESSRFGRILVLYPEFQKEIRKDGRFVEFLEYFEFI